MNPASGDEGRKEGRRNERRQRVEQASRLVEEESERGGRRLKKGANVILTAAQGKRRLAVPQCRYTERSPAGSQ